MHKVKINIAGQTIPSERVADSSLLTKAILVGQSLKGLLFGEAQSLRDAL